MLADLESLERRVVQTEKKAKTGDKESKALFAVMSACLEALRAGKPVRKITFAAEERPIVQGLNLLTAKPVLYIANVDEASAAAGNAYSSRVEARAKEDGATSVVISARIEAELAQLPREERAAFLADIGLEEPGLARLVRAGYALLHLVTYFTVGPKETRAWTVEVGTKAPQAAGVIHSDFEKGFIRAETIAYDDYVGLGGEQGAKESGRMRLEGKDYVVADGDVLHFRFAT
jgi:GTP-binding protein YchF